MLSGDAVRDRDGRSATGRALKGLVRVAAEFKAGAASLAVEPARGRPRPEVTAVAEGC